MASMTQAALAEKLGVSAEMIRLYEKGDNRPGIDKLEKLAELLGVSQGELVKRMAPDLIIDPPQTEGSLREVARSVVLRMSGPGGVSVFEVEVVVRTTPTPTELNLNLLG